MDRLPVEILAKITDSISPPLFFYKDLSPREQVQLQLVSRLFFSLSRDNTLWRLNCYESSWAASHHASATLKSSLESLPVSSVASLSSLGSNTLRSLIQPRMLQSEMTDAVPGSDNRNGNDGSLEFSTERRWRAAAEWDPSYEVENIDWYSEYIARHGPLSFSWLQQPYTVNEHSRKTLREVKGMGLLRDWNSAREDRVIAPLEDGTVCVWDLNYSHTSSSPTTKGKIAGVSARGILLADMSRRSEKSVARPLALGFLSVGECVSVDSIRRRVYISVGNVLNEVDLETLQVISQERYAWSIFAMSQETDYSVPLTLATTLSLQIYDSRLPTVHEEAGIALRCENEPAPYLLNSSLYARPDCQVLQLQADGSPPRRIRSPDPSDKSANYAPLFQPGPLSILHPPAPYINTILLAGRFPSILCYDRRFFPQLQNTVHSGGRLCGLTSIPAPRYPFCSQSQWPGRHSIAACGEYNGKGSLELYNIISSGTDSTASCNSSSTLSVMYQNRQSAARSKLLSVASHGAHIVYSDADGNIKWVERDGRAVFRRWNINADRGWSTPLNLNDQEHAGNGIFRSADTGGHHDVARKILPTDANLAGDEILIWTGDRIGRLRFSHPTGADVDEDEEDLPLDDEFDSATRLAWRQRRQEELQRDREYSGIMRRALERQADEVRWMGRLGMA
ncbi:hypothetical protein Egran_05151 [Elaphomyces granulatus]|uniref:F-box domain-containing protein n=1 Tax=Elaphomyces granulatus TaxID=519963 RepID=A0A232LSF4_9EURO|nr:hypothetical protein Egran_05151 [Elaphomyces granulatus]